MIHHILISLANFTAPTGLPTTDLTSSGTIKSVVSFLLAAAGAITLLIIGVAGFRYTISRGDSNKVKEAKEAIIYSVAGLVIVMAAYTIVQFVFNGVKK